jgi:hypothetical protein
VVVPMSRRDYAAARSSRWCNPLTSGIATMRPVAIAVTGRRSGIVQIVNGVAIFGPFPPTIVHGRCLFERETGQCHLRFI